ncbi:hypothetical protein [Fibrobacter sp. UWP2]|uniref:hypothetical protein n=1 Tax=Fibrobacter sp. UWP2 TaxID=1896216 RepID=UPI0009232308|nr:hypothetical protein [Fibrobacter sp. UWP2]SHI81982.1 hypothetical protein SAMN05720471_10885 [Fibrobacter sp. UWP2]
MIANNQLLKEILLEQLRNNFSTDFYINTLIRYKNTYEDEDMETIRQMVVEEIQNKAEELIRQINSIQFGNKE